MHIILDVHSLPGGINGLTIGEATGHWGWLYNQTNFDYYIQVIDAVLAFIQDLGHPESFTLEPMNETADNRDLSVFGTPAALSDAGAKWVLKYIQAGVRPRRRCQPPYPRHVPGQLQGRGVLVQKFLSQRQPGL